MLKNHKHLKPFIIVTRSLSQPHPTLQILRHTSLLPGQAQGRLAALVTQTNTNAVPLAVRRTHTVTYCNSLHTQKRFIALKSDLHNDTKHMLHLSFKALSCQNILNHHLISLPFLLIFNIMLEV